MTDIGKLATEQRNAAWSRSTVCRRSIYPSHQ